MSYLGYDPGMSGHKVVGKNGSVLLPASVSINGAARVSAVAGLNTVAKPTTIKLPQGSFYVGEQAAQWGRAIENFDSTKFNGTPDARAVTYGALSQYNRLPGAKENVVVVLGLPNDMLVGSDAEVQARVSMAKSWLTGSHTWQVDDVPDAVKINRVIVTSQAAGGLFDYALEEDGKISKDPQRRVALTGEVGVISVGFKTAEFMALEARKINPNLTRNSTSGVRRLLQLLDPNGLYALSELDTMLRAGRLPYKPALPTWGAEVIGDIEKFWGKTWRRFDKVLIFGGGAALLRETLLLYFQGKAWLPDEPVMGIARGLYKAGAVLDGKK